MNGILTTKTLQNFPPMPNLLLFPLRGYLPITNTTFPKLPQHVVFVNQTLNNGLENLGAASKGFIERRTQVGYSYLKPLSIDIEVPFKDRETKSITDKQRPTRTQQRSVLEAKNKIRYYWKSTIPTDDNTTYRLSYWECPQTPNEPVRPRNCLTTGDGDISDESTYKASYLGNWCIQPDPSIVPCEKQLLGRGPIQDITTQKHDYSWKSIKLREPFKPQQQLYCLAAKLSVPHCQIDHVVLILKSKYEILDILLRIAAKLRPDDGKMYREKLFKMMTLTTYFKVIEIDDTTYNLSYYESDCRCPSTSYAPIRKYAKPCIPIDDSTTYKLSYWANDATSKEEQVWCHKREYLPPVEPIDACTTYKLSYWPHSEKKRPSVIIQGTDNILNAGCCSDTNTTYGLSYFGSEGDKRNLIRQPENILFSSCPPAYDTVHRMSFFGNYGMNQEMMITPCDKQMLGKGPMQNVTTQKHDYTWKLMPTQSETRPEDNLVCASSPLECCTTHRLSYIPNEKPLVPIKTYAPVRQYTSPHILMDSETTMQLSYQPVDLTDKVEKPCDDKSTYHLPDAPMEDSTTYNTRNCEEVDKSTKFQNCRNNVYYKLIQTSKSLRPAAWSA
ncbi:hypothetical protein WN55_06232 [Dufourea novaeangliae]|uniref:Uncharacterized protein n=1 Tax=Dufourea novaeangliae TaxID=178035 RepID=A0A154PQ38_DUFNO|nr:hypothetical protein WN55_06232 [Dufourea novaeangliae]